MCIHWAPTRSLCQSCGQELLFHTRATAAGIPAARQPPERPRIYHLPKGGHAKDTRGKRPVGLLQCKCMSQESLTPGERTKNTQWHYTCFPKFPPKPEFGHTFQPLSTPTARATLQHNTSDPRRAQWRYLAIIKLEVFWNLCYSRIIPNLRPSARTAQLLGGGDWPLGKRSRCRYTTSSA